jgi:hypothetical protein
MGGEPAVEDERLQAASRCSSLTPPAGTLNTALPARRTSMRWMVSVW